MLIYFVCVFLLVPLFQHPFICQYCDESDISDNNDDNDDHRKEEEDEEDTPVNKVKNTNLTGTTGISGAVTENQNKMIMNFQFNHLLRQQQSNIHEVIQDPKRG